MKLARGRSLYHKKPPPCDLSDESTRKRQSANRSSGRSISVAFPRFYLYPFGCQNHPFIYHWKYCDNRNKKAVCRFNGIPPFLSFRLQTLFPSRLRISLSGKCVPYIIRCIDINFISVFTYFPCAWCSFRYNCIEFCDTILI